MYSIKIRNLHAMTVLGIYEWEKAARRLVIFNIEIQVEDDKAFTSDAIQDAVDYSLIEDQLVSNLAGKQYNLIEKMVADTARLIFSLDNRIVNIMVEADKPGALRQADSVAVACSFSRLS